MVTVVFGELVFETIGDPTCVPAWSKKVHVTELNPAPARAVIRRICVMFTSVSAVHVTVPVSPSTAGSEYQ
jgi:hypothetical protein